MYLFYMIYIIYLALNLYLRIQRKRRSVMYIDPANKFLKRNAIISKIH